MKILLKSGIFCFRFGHGLKIRASEVSPLTRPEKFKNLSVNTFPIAVCVRLKIKSFKDSSTRSADCQTPKFSKVARTVNLKDMSKPKLFQ